MAHPISPIQYRSGKTFAWRNNVVISSSSEPLGAVGDLNLAPGVELVMRHLLRNYRIFSIRTSTRYSEKTKMTELKVLYVPRVKIADRSLSTVDERGSILDRTLFSGQETLPEDLLLSYFVYLYEIIKDHEHRIETEEPWYFFPEWADIGGRDTYLFRSRFFRGSLPRKYITKGPRNKRLSVQQKRLYHITSLRVRRKTKNRSQEFIINKLKLKRAKIISLLKLKKRKKNLKHRSFHRPRLLVKKSFSSKKLARARTLSRRLKNRLIKKIKDRKKESTNARELRLQKLSIYSTLKNKYRTRRKYLTPSQMKYHQEVLVRPTLNRFLLGKELSLLLRKKINLKLKNVFTYLVEKGRIKKRHWGQHLWRRSYRGYIKKVGNYLDIINAFYINTKINFAETHLMYVIMLPFPHFETKFRPYLYFLDAVIKHMWRLKRKYGLIRLTVTGKLAGGRKRTKVKVIGFGKFPKNSYTVEMTHLFAKFTHRFGEFGVKLLMGMKRRLRLKKRFRKNDEKQQKKAKLRQERWEQKERFHYERTKITNPLIAKILGFKTLEERKRLEKIETDKHNERLLAQARLDAKNKKQKVKASQIGGVDRPFFRRKKKGKTRRSQKRGRQK